MSKKDDELNEIFEQVVQVPILDVLEAFVDNLQLHKAGSNYQGYSPFREDSSNTSFTISPSRGVFKDWVMEGYTGNNIKFVSLYQNLTYYEAAMEIALKFNIINAATYSKYRHKKPPRDIVVLEKKYNKVFKPENNIADEYTLDKVFRIFISCCKLSESHKSYLLEKRGLSEEDIKEFNLFTFPSRGIVRTFLKKITEEFGNTDILERIPGFYRRVGESNYTFIRYTGIGIPITNEKNLIIGIQIRKDNDDGQRYTWFSSAFAINDEKKQNEKGTSSGSPVAVIYPKKIKYKSIFITEGFFKAVEIARHFNCICLSVQGVSTWKPIKEIIDRLPAVVSVPDFYVKAIYPAFDADMCRNINVYMQLKKMTDSLREDRSYRIDYISWDMNLGKGIDDMLIAGHKDKILNIDKDAFDREYLKLIEKIIAEKEDIENISQICTKMSCDEFGSFYDRFFDLQGFTKR